MQIFGKADGTNDTVELRLQARAENVALARLALTAMASVAGASAEDTADLRLAVSEVCTNAIVHAYAGREAGVVTLRYRLRDGWLSVAVEDAGAGFDSATLPPDVDGWDGDRSLGLAITRAVTDELEISSDGSGSRIAFAKRIG